MPDDLDPSRPEPGTDDTGEALLDRIAQLESALRSRPVIEQAKGMLMIVHHCDEEQAFRMLITASQATNRKLRDIAATLVEHLPAGDLPPDDVAAAIGAEARRLPARLRGALDSGS